MLDPRRQLELRTRPPGAIVMRQSWCDLLFLHLACDPATIQPLLPEGLTVDTFADATGRQRAWVGLVPFLMKDVRLAFLPPIPGARTFPETNVRTYVHREGQAPGVWFLSLDAANALAVAVARAAFALPYFHARSRVAREGDSIAYSGERGSASWEIEATLGAGVPTPEPGSLDFFLLERYLLYAARGTRLYSGRVFHRPYAVRSAEAGRLRESLVQAAGIAPGPFVHARFCERVDVEVGPLRRAR